MEGLTQIAERGDKLETLRALRQKVASTIDSTDSGRDVASLSRQLQLIMDQIDKLEEEEKNTDRSIDDLMAETSDRVVRHGLRRAE